MELTVWNLQKTYLNQLYAQSDLVKWICCISPSESFIYSAQAMARTDIEAYRNFMRYANSYVDLHSRFMYDLNTGKFQGRKMEEIEKMEATKYKEASNIPPVMLSESILMAVPNISILIAFNVLFFVLSVFFFIRYNVH